MSSPVRKRPAAQRDLLNQSTGDSYSRCPGHTATARWHVWPVYQCRVAWFRAFCGPGGAGRGSDPLRFLQAAEFAIPGMGQVEDFDHPRLTGIRRWRVRGFNNYLIFYQPLS